jgi:hypothetical protein
MGMKTTKMNNEKDKFKFKSKHMNIRNKTKSQEVKHKNMKCTNKSVNKYLL